MKAPPRLRTDELMDAPEQDRAELAGALEHVAAVDRWLGGARAIRRHLEPVVAAAPRGALLDVGTGNGTVLRRLVAWARRTGGEGWRGVGVDLHPDVVGVAARREPATRIVRGDALALPFPDAVFDAVVCTLTLHHFGEADAVRAVSEMARVSRGVVLVNDLERSLSNYVGARLLAATWWRSNRLTRHDGPVSVLRSFTRDELRDLARRAGLDRPRVRRHFPFRLVLEGWSREGDA